MLQSRLLAGSVRSRATDQFLMLNSTTNSFKHDTIRQNRMRVSRLLMVVFYTIYQMASAYNQPPYRVQLH